MRLDEWLRQAKQRLRDAGVEEARWDAGQIAQHALGQPRAWIVAHGDEPRMEPAVREQYPFTGNL